MPLSNTLNKSLLDNLTTVVILLDQFFLIKYINTAAEIMLATSQQRCLMLPLTDLITEQTEDIDLQEALIRGQPCTKLDAKLLINHKYIMADYIITPLIIENESNYLIEITLLDALRISREKVILSQQEGNKLLLKGLAHEIKNPLGGIRGAAQLLARELGDDSLQEYSRIFIEEADRLCNLVDRMLDSDKHPHIQPVNIHELLERVYQLISAESQGHILINKDYDPSIPEVSVDPSQIIQALLNIARNSLQALIEANTEQPQITFKTRIIRQFTIAAIRHRLVLNIDITDNGPGIPSQLQDTLFYPMVSGRAEGTGLGLSITQNIIIQHKGLIEYTSQPGHTQFSIFIPLEKEQPSCTL